MSHYGTHTYNTDLQVTLALSALVEDDGLQWEVSVTVICTSPYRPSQLYGEPEDCYPAEGPEFEFVEFKLFVGKTTILKSTDWLVAEALFGKMIWNQLYDEAVLNAEENPEESE